MLQPVPPHPAGLQNLPDDILRLVVEAAIGPRETLEDVIFNGSDGRRAIVLLPHRLSSVCRDLRDQIHSIPSLWSIVFVTFVDHAPTMDVQLSLMRNQVHRAGASPLYIYLSSAPNLLSESFVSTLRWLEAVLPQAHTLALWTGLRDQRLTPDSPCVTLLRTTLQLQRLSFNSVKNISPISSDAQSLFPSNSSIQSARLCTVSPSAIGADQLRHLKHLQLVCCTMQTDELVLLSDWWPELETLSLSLTTSLGDLRGLTAPHSNLSSAITDQLKGPPGYRFTMQYLTSLEISGGAAERFYEQAVFGRSAFTVPTPGPNIAWISPNPSPVPPPAPEAAARLPMHLPALREIRSTFSRTFAPDTFIRFFSEVAPGITDLTFVDSHPHDRLMMGYGRFVAEVVSYTPNLRRVAFENLWFDAREFASWGTCPVPVELEVLRFHDCRILHGAAEALVDALKPKTRPAENQTASWKVHCLRIAQVDKTPLAMPVHTVEELRELVDTLEFEDMEIF